MNKKDLKKVVVTHQVDALLLYRMLATKRDYGRPSFFPQKTEPFL